MTGVVPIFFGGVLTVNTRQHIACNVRKRTFVNTPYDKESLMRITDCHVHVFGDGINVDDVLRAMDKNGVERTLLISMDERVSLNGTRKRLLETKALFDVAPDRLDGLAFVKPTIPGMATLAEEALGEMGYTGLKMMPDHFYMTDPEIEPFLDAMNRISASILFHTGILYYYDDSSRFCQPVYLEKLLHYPNIRFAMAHMAWPWVEECLAVMGRMRAVVSEGAKQWQSYIDITPGVPPHIRKQSIKNAVEYCGVDHIMFGSDDMLPSETLDCQAFVLNDYKQIFDELDITEEQQARIFSGTADEVFPNRR